MCVGEERSERECERVRESALRESGSDRKREMALERDR